MFPMLIALKHLPRGSVGPSAHPYSSAKMNSANFALTEFYEVRTQGCVARNTQPLELRFRAVLIEDGIQKLCHGEGSK
jgi:hypothetical protein